MTFDPNDYDLSGYLCTFDLGQDWVSVRNRSYPPESCPPSRMGRYHEDGQPTYYAASGIHTACAEKFGGRDAPVPDTHEVYSFPPGEYRLFDVNRFISENPMISGLLTGEDHSHAQTLRQSLQRIGCSGVLFPSAQDPGGQNAAVWPLDGTPLPSGEFFLPYARGLMEDR